MNLKLINHHTHNTICQYLSASAYNISIILKKEHHFEFENIKNEFFDLENLLKHVLHIEILKNMRYIYIVLYFHGGHFEKWLRF